MKMISENMVVDAADRSQGSHSVLHKVLSSNIIKLLVQIKTQPNNFFGRTLYSKLHWIKVATGFTNTTSKYFTDPM